MMHARSGQVIQRSAASSRKAMTVAASVAAPAAPPVVKANVAPLFTPFKVGKFELQHRMVYAPLTRMRADAEAIPQPIMQEYYAQRATPGGLMISEGTYISSLANGYPGAPGVYSEKQVEAWKPIVAGVHAKGAVFFTQLWHVGRVAHPDLTGGQVPVSSSAIAPEGEAYVGAGGMKPYVVPKALDKAGIKEVIGQYVQAAKNAIAAGFDGVEVHGANGYLIDQFTKSNSNNRTDEYGGSIENRCRFALEVVAAVVEAVGADKVGIRLSPFNDFLGPVDSTPYATFTYLVEQLNAYPLAYVHMVEGRVAGNVEKKGEVPSLDPFRKVWKGPFISAGGYGGEDAAAAVASGHADLIAFGRHWLANPDLPKRFQQGAPLNHYDRATFYGGGAKGYTDYPFLE